MASHLDDAQEEAKADMTPMIDAVFLLIIFFLCIDFKTLEAKLPAYLPKDKGSQPTEAEPVEQLSLKIVCDNYGEEALRRPNRPDSPNNVMINGHEIHWLLGPVRYDELDELKKELTDIAEDPRQRVPDKDNPGETKRKPVVIEPGESTVYVDVAQTVDAVRAAGFEEINFGGGLGRRK